MRGGRGGAETSVTHTRQAGSQADTSYGFACWQSRAARCPLDLQKSPSSSNLLFQNEHDTNGNLAKVLDYNSC